MEGGRERERGMEGGREVEREEETFGKFALGGTV